MVAILTKPTEAEMIVRIKARVKNLSPSGPWFVIVAAINSKGIGIIFN